MLTSCGHNTRWVVLFKTIQSKKQSKKLCPKIGYPYTQNKVKVLTVQSFCYILTMHFGTEHFKNTLKENILAGT